MSLFHQAILLVLIGSGRLFDVDAPTILASPLSHLAVELIRVWAVVFLTSPEPLSPHAFDRSRLRRLVRASAIADFALIIVSQIGVHTDNLGMALVSGFSAEWLIAIHQIAKLTYLRHLANRAEQAALVKSTQRVLWGFAIAYILLAVPVLIALILLLPGTTFEEGRKLTMNAWLSTDLGRIGLFTFGIWYLILLLRYNATLTEILERKRGTGRPN